MHAIQIPNRALWKSSALWARAACLCCLLIGAIGALQPQPALAQQPPIALTVEADSATAQPGETVNFTVTLENVSAQNLPNIMLKLTPDGPIASLSSTQDSNASSGVQTDGLRRANRMIQWKGGLAQGGKLVINVSLRARMLGGQEGEELTLDAEAGPANGAAQINAQARTTVDYPDPLDLDNMNVEIEAWSLLDGRADVQLDANEILPGQEIGLRLLLSGDLPFYSIAQMTLEAELNGTFRRSGMQTLRGTTYPLPDGKLLDATTEGEPVATLLGASEAANGEHVLDVLIRGTFVGASDETAAVSASAHFAAAPAMANAASATETTAVRDLPFNRAEMLTLLESPALKGLLLLLVLIAPDLGDAPDSSNHFGVLMEAYPGITAKFPTVFDITTGAPEGPKHRNARPVHLGAAVSPEREADQGILLRNLDPVNDLADLDLRDDGVDPNALNFGHCFPTTIPYEVTISQFVIDTLARDDKPLYVNAWLDGNHDGDWEDSLLCDGLTAVEHIVIDQEISLSTPGTHSLILATGNLPVPLNGDDETMWLRIMLSDEPSTKTDVFQNAPQPPQEYGDGRGPATPYRWGETEDYLYIPANPQTPGGADLDIRFEIAPGSDFLSPIEPAAAGATTRPLFARIQIRNRGDRMAAGSTLVLEQALGLGIPTIQELSGYNCLTCTVASNVQAAAVTSRLPFTESCEGEQCRTELALGDLPPNTEFELLLGWSWEESRQGMLQARVESASDANAANNRIDRPTPLLLEPIRLTVPGGTVNGSSQILRGLGEPGAIIAILVDGVEAGITRVNELGSFEFPLDLTSGPHEVLGWTGCLTCTVASGVGAYIGEPSDALLLDVREDLPWNPSSFGVTFLETTEQVFAAKDDDSCGPWSIRTDTGSSAPNDWIIPAMLGIEHEIVAQLQCPGGNTPADGFLLEIDGLVEAQLTDPDADGLYSALYTPAIGSSGQDGVCIGSSGQDGVCQQWEATLVATCGDDEFVFSGSSVEVQPARVIDAESGDPVSLASVALFSAHPGADRAFSQWKGHAYGQINPQISDDDGHFRFIAPVGRYGLSLVADGYQPLRRGPFRLDGQFPAVDIALNPLPTAGGPQSGIQIGEEGFYPAELEVEPGAIVRWTNVSLESSSTVGAADGTVTAAALSGSWDSGLLQPGESFDLVFDSPGVYTYVDGEDPTKLAIITVAPKASGEQSVYLPFMVAQ